MIYSIFEVLVKENTGFSKKERYCFLEVDLDFSESSEEVGFDISKRKKWFFKNGSGSEFPFLANSAKALNMESFRAVFLSNLTKKVDEVLDFWQRTS